MDKKLGEWRPDECETRLGDFVLIGKQTFIKIKCRRCSKLANDEVFHLSPALDDNFTPAFITPT